MHLAKVMQQSKRTAAVVAALALALTPSASIGAQSRTNWDRTSSAQTIQRVNKLVPGLDWPEFQRTWEKMSSGRNRIMKYAPSAAAETKDVVAVLPSDDVMRKAALRMASDKNKAIAQRGTRFLTWLDIASAKTPQERHEKIRRLPVSVIESKTSDGRIQKDFVIRGKVTRRVFAPAVPSDHPSGPSAFNCYNDEPEPCLTQEEQDDLVIFIAAAADETAAMQSELDSEWAEYEAYCNTWGCEEGENPAEAAHGPSEHTAAQGCAAHAVVATVGGAMAAFEIIDGAMGVGGAVAHSALIATAEAAAISSAITVGVLLFAYGMYNFVQCKRAKIVAAPHEGVSDRLRPVFGSALSSTPSLH